MGKRTALCGMLRPFINQRVTIQGWLDSVRNLKGLAFIKLRDHSGTVQVVLGKPELLDLLRGMSAESVLAITGEIVERDESQQDPKSPQGDIELRADTIQVLNISAELPFQISSKITELKESEETLFRYRALHMRRAEVQNVLRKRHEFVWAARSYMSSQGFVEVETPILAKSTPEGARDFLIPSRRFKGKFYALPQSPQLFKQMCVIGGIDRYFQVARCFRDEDTRQDRLLEFTQLDIEMAFAEADDVIEVVEGLFSSVLREAGININLPLPKYEYDYLKENYGSDKPDLRGKEGFGEHAAFWVVNFPLFEWSDEEGRLVSSHHPFTAPVDEHKDLVQVGNPKLGELRSKAYDLVWNGVEVGGGSIRIHNSELQRRVFDVLGISPEEQSHKFGFLLRCLDLGAPPHGGLAIGLDRLVQILTNQRSVRDCVAFPYSQKGYSPMLDAPSDVGPEQLSELGIRVSTIPGIFILDDQEQQRVADSIQNFGSMVNTLINTFPYDWDRAAPVSENIERAKGLFQQNKSHIDLVILDHYFDEPAGGVQKDCLSLDLLAFFKRCGKQVVVLTGAHDPMVYFEFGRRGADYIVKKNVAGSPLTLRETEEIFKLLC